MNSAINSD